LDAAHFVSLTGDPNLMLSLSPTYIRKQPFYLFIPLLACALSGVLSGCAKKAEQAAPRVVAVTMKKGDISPKEIRVKQNEPVRLAVSTLDVQHGFEIPQLGVSEPVNPGKPAEVALDTSRKGSFKVQCGVMCGAHHDEMRAVVVVE
jgi:heme/copper-type cytochrome/quinol oxidase subunit 2